jgi:glutaminyl-peptide cyclotransferase
MASRIKLSAALAVCLVTIIFAVAVAAAGCQAASVARTGVPETGASDSNPAGQQTDANRAYDHVKKMVALGPRPSGSPTIKKCQGYIESELKSYGLKIVEDQFTADTPRGKIPMMNIIAELPGKLPEVVLITGHYDTAPLPNFVGANDGGSSAASVLEMARVLAGTNPEYTLWFVFFDGEEAVVSWESNNGMDNTYGSRHLTAKLKADGSLKQVKAMVLVDMIGDKKLDIYRDAESTSWMVDAIWDTARRMGHGKAFLGNETGMSDDHIPFKNAGIPVVDIIDFDFGPDNSYWHTPQDTLDKISGDSIKVVSDVVIEALPEIYKHIASKVKP